MRVITYFSYIVTLFYVVEEPKVKSLSPRTTIKSYWDYLGCFSVRRLHPTKKIKVRLTAYTAVIKWQLSQLTDYRFKLWLYPQTDSINEFQLDPGWSVAGWTKVEHINKL